MPEDTYSHASMTRARFRRIHIFACIEKRNLLYVYSVAETGLNMLPNLMIKFNLSETDKLANTYLRYIRIGFMTKKKQGILLQMRGTTNSEYVSLEINNSGKHNQLTFRFVTLYYSGLSDITKTRLFKYIENFTTQN